MEQLAHDGDDDLPGFLAVLLEPVAEGFEQRVVHPCGHGGHEHGAPQVHGADLGDGGLAPARCAAFVVARGETRPGGELACVLEFGEVGQLADDGLCGDVADAGDGLEELVSGEESGIGLDGGEDVFADGLDFLFEEFDGACDGGGDGLFRIGGEPGLEPGGVPRERVGVAVEVGDPLLLRAPGLPGAQPGLLGHEESGDELRVGGVALVAPQLLLAEGLDALRVDEVEAVDPACVEGGCGEISVVAGLLQAGAGQNGGSRGGQPFQEGFNPCGGVVEALRGGLPRADDVAEKILLADIDAEEKLGVVVVGVVFILLLVVPRRAPGTSLGGVVTVSSKQIRDLRCCSDFEARGAAQCLILFTDSSG